MFVNYIMEVFWHTLIGYMNEDSVFVELIFYIPIVLVIL